MVTRPGGNLVDFYFHLQDGACDSFPPDGPYHHVEQGDFLAWAGSTGVQSGFIHLHYEVRPSTTSGPEDSVWHALSGINNFCDHNDSGEPDSHDGEIGFQCTVRHAGEYYTSDNGGPGANLAGNTTAENKIHSAYKDKGHYMCGANRAWNCFGSSVNLLGEGFLATRSCLGASNDCGWNQDFVQSSSDGGKLSIFGWPEACGVAYWVPDQFAIAWLNNTWLGQPRSSVYLSNYGYVQNFRHGYLLSNSFGGPANALQGGPNPCSS